MSDETTEKSLARQSESALAESPERGWRGDDHKLMVASAAEAGLDTNDAELESYQRGFKQGLVLDDPADHAIVLRGRTVLRDAQFQKALKPMLMFLKVPRAEVATRVHDGEFEMRVSRGAAEKAAPALDSAKMALRIWIAAGILGVAVMEISTALSAILWGVGLMVGGWGLRQGLVNGRSLLAARLTLGLAMLAREEKLILPPAGEDGT